MRLFIHTSARICVDRSPVDPRSALLSTFYRHNSAITVFFKYMQRSTHAHLKALSTLFSNSVDGWNGVIVVQTTTDEEENDHKKTWISRSFVCPATTGAVSLCGLLRPER